MSPTPSEILSQLDAVLNSIWIGQDIRPQDEFADEGNTVFLEEKVALARHAVDQLAPLESVFQKRADEVKTEGHLRYQLGVLAGILTAMRTAYEHGLLRTVEELIHADVFDNLLDRAAYLLDGGYKDAAAVIAGGVLEEHVRRLCTKHGVAVTVATAKGEEHQEGLSNE